MKKCLSFVAIVLLAVFVLSALAACKTEKVDELVIYNWADYIYDEDLDDFEEYYEQITGRKIKTTYVTFDTNETMLTRLTKGDSNVDVVCPSDYAIQKLIEMDMLVPMNYFDEDAYESTFSSNVNKTLYEHNGANVDDNIIQKVNETFSGIEITADGDNKGKKVPMTDYFVPYMYGTLGILYNKYAFKDMNIFDKEMLNKANWGILFNDNGEGGTLSDELNGNILMKDSIRDSYAATVFYLAESGKLDGLVSENGTPYTEMTVNELINAVDDQLLEKVKEALIEQKQQLFGYEVDFGKDDLLSGNAIVDLAWSGDAIYAVEESWNDKLDDYELAYYVPHSTGNIWFDGWVVPKSHNPEHLDAIKLFINYLNRPDVAAENLLAIGYTAAVKPNVLRNDEDAKAALAEGYLVYAPELWDVTDENGKPIPQEECDFADWKEFDRYFFDNTYVEDGEVISYDTIGGANWRYPFSTVNSGNYNRDWQTTLGVMCDFGDKNHDVVTAWNYSRSVGDSALPMLGWTALAVAVVIGAVFAVIGIKRTFRHTVKLNKR